MSIESGVVAPDEFSDLKQEWEVLRDKPPGPGREYYQKKQIAKVKEEEAKADKEAKDAAKQAAKEKAKASRDAADAKRIAERDVTNARLKGIKAISIDLLKVVDELEHAVNASKEENIASTNTTVRDGISLVQNNFTKVLESHGVTKIDAFEGMQFDPNMHEAVSVTVIDDKEEQTIDTISLVAQEGYMLNEIVLRAPKVNVYKESE